MIRIFDAILAAGVFVMFFAGFAGWAYHGFQDTASTVYHAGRIPTLSAKTAIIAAKS